MTETVTITKEEYESLLADKERLDLLKSELVEIVYLDCGTLCLRSTVNEVEAFPALNVRRGIDELKKKIESNTKENEKGWISVKDRLPQPIDTSAEYRNQENKSVIYYTEDDEYWFIGFGWYVYGDKEDCDGCLIPYWELEDTGLTEVDVTHWRPLPPPPKTE